MYVDSSYSTAIVDAPHQWYAVEKVQQRPPDPYAFLKNRVASLRIDVSSARLKVLEYGQMPENWDGYGAASIGAETITNALSVLDIVLRSTPVPDIVPNANGTLSFEWETVDGFAHLEIGNTRFAFYLKHRSAQPVCTDGRTDLFPANLIGSLISAMLYSGRNAAPTITKIKMFNDVWATA